MSGIYKPGQGRYARISAGVLLALFVGYGCAALQSVLSRFESLSPLAIKLTPVGVFLVAVVAIAWALNYAKFADFLIETEIEMGRVAWPSRREVVSSSLVVIISVILMAAFLYGADWMLLQVLKVVHLY